ncbi:MAG: ABC transporter ATP-binding protein [Candidatus Dasytiphilus stammeri]
MNYALQLINLMKIYPGGINAIKGINLKIINGDFYALLGPNGAGKTTIIGIICSLINPTMGKVKIFGYDLQRNSINAKILLGLVPQEFNFNPFETVLQIIINQAGYYGVKKHEALKKAKKYLFHLNLWDQRFQMARMLSGGMKRRLMIIRALIHSPKLLILDEPTAGVDIELRRLIWNFLNYLNKNGTTIILTTHYLEEAEILCRNIGIVHKGRIIENTSMKILLSKLKKETIILDLTQDSPIPQLKDCNFVLKDSCTLEVEIDRKKGLNNIFHQLNNQGIQVLSMRNKKNRLEALFLNLVKEQKQKGLSIE